MSGNEQRPGGWVDGIGWVAWLHQLPEGTTCTPTRTKPIPAGETVRVDADGMTFPVIVTRWADGTSPVPSVDDEQPDTRRVPTIDDLPEIVAYAELLHGLKPDDPAFRPRTVLLLADEIDRLRGADAHRVQPQPDELRAGRLRVAAIMRDEIAAAELDAEPSDYITWLEALSGRLLGALAASPATEAPPHVHDYGAGCDAARCEEWSAQAFIAKVTGLEAPPAAPDTGQDEP